MQFSPVNIKERKALDIRPGDTVRVWQKVKEKDKTRLQVFEGLVIARKHGTEPGATFTVRKISKGIGIELTFPLFSPNIEKIELISRTKMRRAKLYFLRERSVRAVKKKMRQLRRINEVVINEENDKNDKNDNGENNINQPESRPEENN